MNNATNLSPLLALVLAQFADNESKLLVYGPMGIICLWLMYREEVRSKESGKLRDEISKVAHEMKGLNRNLLYVTATSGTTGLREVARKELERKSAAGED